MESKKIATLTVFFGMFIAAMESLIGATILPSILSSLGGLDLYPWVGSGFLLVLVLATPIFGQLSDNWGFFKSYLLATSLFILGSMGCGLSLSMPMLVISRGIQGAGTAGLITLCLIYAGLAYPLKIRHKVQAVISLMWALASLIGPALASFIVMYASWRWVFLINIPLSLLILLGASIYLRHLPQNNEGKTFDYQGAFLFLLGIASFLLILISVEKGQWGPPQVGLMVISCLSLGLMIYMDQGKEDSFIPLKLVLASPHETASMGIGLLGGGFLFSTASLLPLFIQGAQGLPVQEVGKVVASMALGTCAGSVATAFLLGRAGFRITSISGSMLVFIGVFLLTRLDLQSPLTQAMAANFLLGTGIGISANNAIVATQTFAPFPSIGMFTSLFSFSRSMGGMLFLSFLGALQLYSFRENISRQAGLLYPEEALELYNNPEIVFNNLDRPPLSTTVLEVLSESFEYSLLTAFKAMLPFVLLHLFCSCLMPNKTPKEISELKK